MPTSQIGRRRKRRAEVDRVSQRLPAPQETAAFPLSSLRLPMGGPGIAPGKRLEAPGKRLPGRLCRSACALMRSGKAQILPISLGSRKTPNKGRGYNGRLSERRVNHQTQSGGLVGTRMEPGIFRAWTGVSDLQLENSFPCSSLTGPPKPACLSEAKPTTQVHSQHSCGSGVARNRSSTCSPVSCRCCWVSAVHRLPCTGQAVSRRRIRTRASVPVSGMP